jgi:hypothetical protein
MASPILHPLVLSSSHNITTSYVGNYFSSCAKLYFFVLSETMYLSAPPTIPAYQVLQRNSQYLPLVLKKKKGVNVGHPRHKNVVLGSILCRHDSGMSAKCANIWLLGRHVADMSATMLAKGNIQWL